MGHEACAEALRLSGVLPASDLPVARENSGDSGRASSVDEPPAIDRRDEDSGTQVISDGVVSARVEESSGAVESAAESARLEAE